MRHQKYLRMMMVVCLSFVAAGLYSYAAEEKDKAAGPQASNAKARVDAARNAYEGALQRQVQEPDMVSRDVGYDWSVRWLQAERDLRQSKAEHIVALEAHLKRMQTLKEKRAMDFRNGMVAPYEIDSAEFFRLEAEDWLAAAKVAAK